MTECQDCCFKHLFSCLGLEILTQPKNVVCQPGDKLGFSIETSKIAQAYQWCLNGIKITTDNKGYEGCISEKLSINGCLPKHKGSYQCIVVTELDTSLSTEIATLKIGMFTELCQTPYITFVVLSTIGPRIIGGLQKCTIC